MRRSMIHALVGYSVAVAVIVFAIVYCFAFGLADSIWYAKRQWQDPLGDIFWALFRLFVMAEILGCAGWDFMNYVSRKYKKIRKQELYEKRLKECLSNSLKNNRLSFDDLAELGPAYHSIRMTAISPSGVLVCVGSEWVETHSGEIRTVKNIFRQGRQYWVVFADADKMEIDGNLVEYATMIDLFDRETYIKYVPEPITQYIYEANKPL